MARDAVWPGEPRACPWLPACLCSRDALRPCRGPTANPEAELASRGAGELYISLVDPRGAQMLLAQVPLTHSQYRWAPDSCWEEDIRTVAILRVKADVRVKCRRTNAACV